MVGVAAVYGKQRRRHDAAIGAYKNTRMCLRCGAFYLGSPNIDFDTASMEQGNNSAWLLGFFILALVGAVITLSFHRQQSENQAPGAPSREQPEPLASQPSDSFSWPTNGLPAHIADALSAPDLAPNVPGISTELRLGRSGQKQILSVSRDCGAEDVGGTSWMFQMADPSSAVSLVLFIKQIGLLTTITMSSLRVSTRLCSTNMTANATAAKPATTGWTTNLVLPQRQYPVQSEEPTK